MRKRLIAVVIGVGLAVGSLAGPAAAHDAGPCGATVDPGHSEFAIHHVVALAHDGELGAGGHAPGAHQGYSSCQ
jgi:hypothetical protein